MQGAANEKKDQWNNMVSEVKNLNPDDIKKTAAEFTHKVRDVSTEVYDDAIGYVRANPLVSALGLVAFGFFAATLTNWLRPRD